jgi:hypothetical protein
VGVVVGPRVIDAGASLLSVLISPVPVAAGYPSPAQDYFDGRIDLNEHLIKDITSTYVVRVSGDSMEGAGISDGDELIVNRALEQRTRPTRTSGFPPYPIWSSGASRPAACTMCNARNCVKRELRRQGASNV